MNPFTGILKEINEKLDLPQPEKSKIILEISSDLNDALAHYLAEGLPREDAIAKATETFKISDDSINQLTQIHESLFRRLMDRLSKQVLNRWEKGGLIILVLFISIFTGHIFLNHEFFTNASRFVWSVAGIALVVMIMTLWKFYQLFIKRDHRIRFIRQGLPLIFFLGISSLFMGVYGLVTDTYITMSQIQMSLPSASIRMMNFLLGISSLMIVSLLVAVLTELIWFFLMNKVIQIELAEATVLLECEQ